MTREKPTVLVVDDEPAVRDVAVAMLGELGVVVFEAGDGATALALLERHPEIDLLLTDVRMPEMTGVELAHKARSLRPHLRVIFVSGYAGDAVLPDVRFVSKPLRLSTIAALCAAEAT